MKRPCLDQAPSGPAELVDYPAASAYKGAALRNLSARFDSQRRRREP